MKKVCNVSLLLILQPGECEDTDKEEDHQQPQLLVRLAQRGQQALQALEMANQLEESCLSLL